MKLITRDTDYALRALCLMAKRKGKMISVSDMVRELKMPRPFLRKILQRLNKEKILKSYKGLGGGFLLAMPENKIFLTDLMEIFQGNLHLNECFFKKLPCPNIKTCRLRKKINNIERFVKRELKAITIASLLK